jgi:hypothetical protein
MDQYFNPGSIPNVSKSVIDVHMRAYATPANTNLQGYALGSHFGTLRPPITSPFLAYPTVVEILSESVRVPTRLEETWTPDERGMCVRGGGTGLSFRVD